MSLAEPHDQLELPVSLEKQLLGYRRRVRTIKMLEAAGIATASVIAAFLCVFALDRLWDTPAPVRWIALALAVATCAVVPLYLYRWIWRRRRLEQLAHLLSRKLPSLGDQLLGIIELARSETEQDRSRDLCAAAIEQVACETHNRDLSQATPPTRHRMWGWLSVGAVGLALGLAMIVPAAAGNAWARFLSPWSDTPRYTFAAVGTLPDELIVPHGEPFTVTVGLKEESLWSPERGQVQLGQQQPVDTPLIHGTYEFELPPQIEAGSLQIHIGDARHQVRIKPTLRPELTAVVADVSLPDYLGLTEPLQKDARGGSISLVDGSQATIAATASRTLSEARVDGVPETPVGATVSSPPTDISGERDMQFEWQDEYGLAGREPFTISITGHEDEAPTLSCENLPRRKVVLDSEQLTFRVKVRDDFGVKRVGMQWQGVEHPAIETPAAGERMLMAGGHDKDQLELGGTFTAQTLGIEPQLIRLRIFAEDYFPGRERAYSPVHLLYVLNAEQHAIWMTEQLSKWHRQSLEVRDREMQLYEANKQLRDLSSEELDSAETRRRIENQASAERTNGRRLSNLTTRGEDLVLQASRNPEFGVGHLEKWAEMLQILKDISANRMPSVSDLLKQASQAEAVAQSKPSSNSPAVGQIRNQGSSSSSESESDDEQKPSPAAPQIVDIESSQQPVDPESQQPPGESKGGSAGLGLPTTSLVGGVTPGEACAAGEKMAEAVEEQRDLLAEFEKIANELNTILANLEGSTLVKRLKAASREQYRIAGRIGDQLDDSFGLRLEKIAKQDADVLHELAGLEEASSYKVSLIMDDMQAYFERRRFMQFKTVLDDMEQQDVVGSLMALGDDIPKEHGVSIAQCEYWSDAMDRWAEDLVDPAKGGT